MKLFFFFLEKAPAMKLVPSLFASQNISRECLGPLLVKILSIIVKEMCHRYSARAKLLPPPRPLPPVAGVGVPSISPVDGANRLDRPGFRREVEKRETRGRGEMGNANEAAGHASDRDVRWIQIAR